MQAEQRLALPVTEWGKDWGALVYKRSGCRIEEQTCAGCHSTDRMPLTCLLEHKGEGACDRVWWS